MKATLKRQSVEYYPFNRPADEVKEFKKWVEQQGKTFEAHFSINEKLNGDNLVFIRNGGYFNSGDVCIFDPVLSRFHKMPKEDFKNTFNFGKDAERTCMDCEYQDVCYAYKVLVYQLVNMFMHIKPEEGVNNLITALASNCKKYKNKY